MKQGWIPRNFVIVIDPNRPSPIPENAILDDDGNPIGDDQLEALRDDS